MNEGSDSCQDQLGSCTALYSITSIQVATPQPKAVGKSCSRVCHTHHGASTITYKTTLQPDCTVFGTYMHARLALALQRLLLSIQINVCALLLSYVLVQAYSHATQNTSDTIPATQLVARHVKLLHSCSIRKPCILVSQSLLIYACMHSPY